MTQIPDATEVSSSKIERMIDEVGPKGKCMGCDKEVGVDDLHLINPHPESPAFCWACCVESWGADPSTNNLTSDVVKE